MGVEFGRGNLRCERWGVSMWAGLRRSIEIVLSCMVLDFDSIVFICALQYWKWSIIGRFKWTASCVMPDKNMGCCGELVADVCPARRLRAW